MPKNKTKIKTKKLKTKDPCELISYKVHTMKCAQNITLPLRCPKKNHQLAAQIYFAP